MGNLTIGALGEKRGVGVETVRFYQRRGLVAEPPRAGGIRRYGARDVTRIRFIKRAQAAGFTLAEIAELIALDSTDDRAQRARTCEIAHCRARPADRGIDRCPRRVGAAGEGMRRGQGRTLPDHRQFRLDQLHRHRGRFAAADAQARDAALAGPFA